MAPVDGRRAREIVLAVASAPPRLRWLRAHRSPRPSGADSSPETSELTLTAGEQPRETGQWIKDLAARHHAFADRLADRQSQTVPSEDPDYGDLGLAFPAWTGPGTDAILQRPKPEIPPSPQILQRAADRDADREAAD